jgi:hypothetical protein
MNLLKKLFNRNKQSKSPSHCNPDSTIPNSALPEPPKVLVILFKQNGAVVMQSIYSFN